MTTYNLNNDLRTLARKVGKDIREAEQKINNITTYTQYN